MKDKKLLLLPLFLFVSNVSANVLIPPLMILAGIYSLFGWSLVLLGFLVELLCIYFLVKNRSFFYIFIAVLVMNVISAVIGALALIGFDSVYFGVARILPRAVSIRIFKFFVLPGGAHLAYIFFFFIFVVLVNSIIELIIGTLFFRDVNKGKLFLYLLLANALSNGIGLAGLFWHVTKYGGLLGM